MKQENMKFIYSFLAILSVMTVADTVWAMAAPAAGSFAYDIYDLAVNSILRGPIGFVAGVAAVALGCIVAMKNQVMLALPCVLGGAALLRADALVVSFGMVF